MLSGKRKDMCTAGLPEIIGQAAVQIVTDAYDESL
jgi:hypothetical protein